MKIILLQNNLAYNDLIMSLANYCDKVLCSFTIIIAGCIRCFSRPRTMFSSCEDPIFAIIAIDNRMHSLIKARWP